MGALQRKQKIAARLAAMGPDLYRCLHVHQSRNPTGKPAQLQLQAQLPQHRALPFYETGTYGTWGQPELSRQSEF